MATVVFPVHLEHGKVDLLHPLLKRVHHQGKDAQHRPHLKKLHLLGKHLLLLSRLFYMLIIYPGMLMRLI